MNRAAKALSRFFQSQSDVAAKLGIGPSQLSLLIAGHRMPSIEVAAAIEQEFGVPCRWWAEQIDERPPCASPDPSTPAKEAESS